MDKNDRLEIALVTQALMTAHLDTLAVVARLVEDGKATEEDIRYFKAALDSTKRATEKILEFSGITDNGGNNAGPD